MSFINLTPCLTCANQRFVYRNRNLGGQLGNVLGYVDGTLVKTKKPSIANNRHAFMGRKGYPCVNVQIVSGYEWIIVNEVGRECCCCNIFTSFSDL